ncbi:U4/U6.U5 tri-snRNP-associated protein 3 [Colletotrichum higginsianum]|nr:U4/U6.U5 tri-snRNP-associated protein 3 [Colletotrichum higginsianum]
MGRERDSRQAWDEPDRRSQRGGGGGPRGRDRDSFRDRDRDGRRDDRDKRYRSRSRDRRDTRDHRARSRDRERDRPRDDRDGGRPPRRERGGWQGRDDRRRRDDDVPDERPPRRNDDDEGRNTPRDKTRRRSASPRRSGSPPAARRDLAGNTETLPTRTAPRGKKEQHTMSFKVGRHESPQVDSGRNSERGDTPMTNGGRDERRGNGNGDGDDVDDDEPEPEARVDKVLELLGDGLELLLDGDGALEADDVPRGRVLVAADGGQGVHGLEDEAVRGGGRQLRVADLDLVRLVGVRHGGVGVHVEDVTEHVADARGRVDVGVVPGQLGCEDDLVGEGLNLLVGLDDGDLDVEGGDLVGERVAEALERPDGRGVDGHAGGADVAARAGEDHDVPRVLGAEEGKGGLDEVDLGEEDGLELVTDEVLGQGAPLAVPAGALALVDELAELGAAALVLDLARRQAGDDVVAVGEQQPDEPDDER